MYETVPVKREVFVYDARCEPATPAVESDGWEQTDPVEWHFCHNCFVFWVQVFSSENESGPP